MVKVNIIAGSYPPEICGIADYTFNLVGALRELGVKVNVLANLNWSFKHANSVFRHLDATGTDIIHLQYPGRMYGHSLIPQLIPLVRSTVVTLHEFSQVHMLRKLSMVPILAKAKHIVFTHSFERNTAVKWIRRVGEHSSIIPIGSSIPFLLKEFHEREKNSVVFFGLIRPNKGIEEFLELVALSKSKQRPYRFKIIGGVAPKFADYAKMILDKHSHLDVTWKINLSPEEVAMHLAESQYGYFHFPDGASVRRSSLLAALGNGVTVLTTCGPQTTSDFDDIVRYCDNPSRALSLIDYLSEYEKEVQVLRHRAIMFAQRYSWQEIARKHLEIYDNIT